MTRWQNNPTVLGVLLLALMGTTVTAQSPLGTAFTYQGELQENDTQVTADCDFAFSLWDSVTAGNQVGPTLNKTISVADGRFTETLDFGIAFLGDASWLQIEVCCPSGCAPGYTPLDPRQRLTPAPNAMRASSGVGGPDALNVANFGRVGIGMSSPDAKLDVSFSVPNARVLRANCAAFGGSFEVRDFAVAGDGTQVVGQWTGNAAGPKVRYQGAGDGTDFVDVGQDGSGGYVILTDFTPRLTIQTGGNVGIGSGTDIPTSKLQVGNFGSSQDEHIMVATAGGNQFRSGIKFRHFVTDLGWTIESDERHATQGLNFIRHNTDATGVSQMFLSVNGNVGIGTSVPGFKLDVAGNISGSTLIATNDFDGADDIRIDGQGFKPGGGFWALPSDGRLKKDVEPLGGTLERLLRLRGVTYEYKDPTRRFALPGRQTGMIAQEVEEVFPEWVGQDEDGFKYIAIRGLTALTVEALRDLRQEKDAQIAALDARNKQLETRIDRLELLMAKSRSDDGGGR